MILTCEQCRTSYRLDDNRLSPEGSTVRCSNCRNMWTAFPPGAADVAAGALAGAAAAGVLAAGAAAPQDDRTSAGSGEESPRFTFELPADETPEDAPGGERGARGEDTAVDEEDFLTGELNLDDLEMILEAGEDEAGPLSGAEELGIAGAGEEGDLPDLGDGFKTEELDLADLEQMLARKTPGGEDAGAADGDDAEELDLSLEDQPSAAEELETLGEEDLQLDFSELDALESQPPAPGPEASGRAAPAARGRDEAQDIGLEVAPELKDLFDGLDEGPAAAIEETAELDLAGLEMDQPPPAPPAAPEEPPLKLEVAEDLEELRPEAELEDVAVEATEDLSLDLLEPVEGDEEDITDIDLDLEALEEAPPEGGAPEDDLLDLDRLLGTSEAAPAAAAGEVEELDLSLLEPDLAPAGQERAPGGDAAPELKLDLGEGAPEELELDLDLGAEAPAELDLDLDLGGEGLTAAAPDSDLEETAADADKTRELDLDDLEAMLKLEAAEPAPPSPEVSDEIDLDLDALEEPQAPAGAEDRTRELDLADLEKMLSGVDAGAASRKPPAAGAAEPPQAPRPKADEGQMLDLSDLEKMLSLEDTTDSSIPEAGAPDELELDLAGPAPAAAAAAPSEDLELDFDMPIDEPDEGSALFDTSESEDLELEFDVGEAAEDQGGEHGELEFEILDEAEGGSGGGAMDAAARATTVTLDQVGRTSSSRAGDITKELVAEVATAGAGAGAAAATRAIPARSPFPRAKTRTTSPLLVVLLILALLAGAGYGLVKYAGIQIPYVSEWLGAKTGGAVVPVESTLKGYFVTNAKAGNLYVVEGQVRNDFASPRSSIRVTGKVFADGKKFQRSASAYCGNVMTPEELQRLDLAEISQRMNNRSGANNSNLRVAPGQSIPFAVVFANLPPEVKLEEFAVEAAGSFPVDQK